MYREHRQKYTLSIYIDSFRLGNLDFFKRASSCDV